MDPLQFLVTAEKTIPIFPGWSRPEPEGGYVWFDAPLDIRGVTEQGFVLHGGTYFDKPDSNLTFELRVSKIPGRRCIPLTRYDWRSLLGGHTNPRRSDTEWSGLRLPSSHFHPFDLNYSAESKRMRRGNLRMATDAGKDLETFDLVREFVGKQFNIKNVQVVGLPPWEYRLQFGSGSHGDASDQKDQPG